MNVGFPPLHRAAFEGDLAALRAELERSHASAIDAPDDEGFTPLLHAARMGHARAVEALARAGASLDLRCGRFGRAALHEAVAMERPDVVRALLEAGADPDAPGHGGEPPLVAAARTADAAIVERLLAAGAHLDAVADSGRSALHEAAAARRPGASGLLRRLLERGLDPNRRDRLGRSPLFDAALVGPEPVTILLAAGADPRLPDERGRTPIDVALDGAQPALAERMMAAGGGASDAEALLVAAAGMREDAGLARVEGLLERGTSAESRARSGDSALDAAVRARSLAVARRLLEAGADPDGDALGGTPLMTAVCADDREAVALLVAHGADPLHPACGSTPLARAVERGLPELVRALRAEDAAPERSAEELAARLNAAARGGDAHELGRLLREHPERASPELFERALGDDATALAVLEHGLLERCLAARDATPLVAALDFRRIAPRTVRRLLEAGLDPNAGCAYGASVLTMLCGQADEPPGDRPIGYGEEQLADISGLIELALERGADPERANGFGERALHLAAVRRPVRAVRALAEAGADLDARDRSGRTPLMLAAGAGRDDTVRFLLSAGARAELTDERGKDARDHALAGGHDEVAARLPASPA